MAAWEAITVREAISRMHDERMVLPVIQRNLVWNEDKMKLLFDSLFRANSFGSIICVEETKDTVPLFAHRIFREDRTQAQSVELKKVSQSTLLIIDGQQRLQSFYSGLCGTYEGKTMYFDLFSNPTQFDFNYNFKFASSESALFKRNRENSKFGEYLWYPAPYLFSQLQQMGNSRLVAHKIIQEKEIDDREQVICIEANIADFYAKIFADNSIGLSKVVARMSDDIQDDRHRIAEMFQRLNTSGTSLSSYDLIASSLKSFNYRVEKFLDDVTRENGSMGIDQGILMKMIMILNDTPTKSIADISSMKDAEEDAKFATNNLVRIKATLEALQKFLKASKNEDWFSSVASRSSIPLYFIAYHIFWHSDNPNEIQDMFNDFDTNSQDFRNMVLWLRLSILNQVFKIGCGWDPNKTGMKKIHEVMRRNKGKIFPVDELFAVHKAHPLHKFFDKNAITAKVLDSLNQEYIFYTIYGGRRATIRNEDKDHIQPRSLLLRARVNEQKINSIGNFQYLDYGTNKGEKSNLELRDWISRGVKNKGIYLSRHLIPRDENLWGINRFATFLSERQKLIAEAIKQSLPD